MRSLDGERRGSPPACHDVPPALVERLLGRVEGSPYTWLTQPLQEAPGPVLDVACGSAPACHLLSGANWVGVDASAVELSHAAAAGRGPLLRGRADALPVTSGAVAAVCAAMCLQALTPLDAVLEEIKRVLRPGGMLAALVPARLGRSPAGLLAWARLLRAAGMPRPRWPNPQVCDGAARLLRRHGFLVTSDERRVYRLELAGPEDAALLLDALCFPGMAPERLSSAKESLARRARPGWRLPVPLRRVVAHLPNVVRLVPPARAQPGDVDPLAA